MVQTQPMVSECMAKLTSQLCADLWLVPWATQKVGLEPY